MNLPSQRLSGSCPGLPRVWIRGRVWYVEVLCSVQALYSPSVSSWTPAAVALVQSDPEDLWGNTSHCTIVIPIWFIGGKNKQWRMSKLVNSAVNNMKKIFPQNLIQCFYIMCILEWRSRRLMLTDDMRKEQSETHT